MAPRQKVLAFLIGSLGDSIVAIPALRVVRENFPNAEIVVLHETGLGLVEPPDVLPAELVDRYISYTRGNSPMLSLARLLPKLRRERFDAGVYLAFSERPAASVNRDRRFFGLAGIKHLIGFQSFSSTELYPKDEDGRPLAVPSEAERKISRLIADGLEPMNDPLKPPWIRPSRDEVASAHLWLAEHALSRPFIAIAPGCKTRANQWPINNFVDLVKAVRQSTDCGIVIVGGPNERMIGDSICDQVTDCVNAAGKFDVGETAALLSECDLYVGLDTGTTHLAAAVGLPVVAIYGQRNNPGQWFPHATSLEIIQTEVPCAGCREQTCIFDGHPCMTGIDVERVAASVLRLLAKRPANAASETA